MLPSTNRSADYLYDGNNLIEEVDNSGNVLARYSDGAVIDESLSEFRSGTTSYYEQDGLGSITSLTGSSGTTANTYIYDSFGNLSGSTGSLANPYRYTGREFDTETGLYYYRARFYDTVAGRFLSEDPIDFGGWERGANLYLYVSNDPVNLIDPTGETSMPYYPTVNGPLSGWQLSHNQRINPLPPSFALEQLLNCIASCYGLPIIVTSTSESAPVAGHTATTPHGRGVAADISYPSDPRKFLCCAAQCGAGFAQDEAQHPSLHATGPHIHIQIPRGRNGGSGDLPKVKPCTNCSQ